MPTEISAQQTLTPNPVLTPAISIGLGVVEVTSQQNSSGAIVRNAARYVALDLTIKNVQVSKAENTVSRVFNEIINSALNNMNPAQVAEPGNFMPPLDQPSVGWTINLDKNFEPVFNTTITIQQLKIGALSETLNDLKVYILAAIQSDLNP